MKNLISLLLAFLTLSSCFSTKKTANGLARGQEKAAQSDIKPRIITYEQTIDSNTVYDIVEKMPEYPGGDEKMLEYLSTNITYPKEAKENGTQGRVYIQFIVEKDGNITHAKVLRGIGDGCDEESLRVVKEMPKWTPGEQRGKFVRVKFNLPIIFKLKEQEELEEKKSFPPPPPPEPESIELIDESVAIKAPETDTITEIMPTFPREKGSMYGFISKNLNYPKEAKENNIAGKVYAQFVVNEDGSITDIKILQGIGGGCDEELERVIKLMPNWNPATKNGKPIKKKMVIPVNFMLEIKAKPKKIETPAKIENLDNWENEEKVEELKRKRSKAIYTFVEEKPEFPGGLDSLNSYLKKT